MLHIQFSGCQLFTAGFLNLFHTWGCIYTCLITGRLEGHFVETAWQFIKISTNFYCKQDDIISQQFYFSKTFIIAFV
jgi:hypothetical protein